METAKNSPTTEALGFREQWIHARLDFPALVDGVGRKRFSLRGAWNWRLYESGKIGRFLFLAGQGFARLSFRTRMAGVLQNDHDVGNRAWAITLERQKS